MGQNIQLHYDLGRYLYPKVQADRSRTPVADVYTLIEQDLTEAIVKRLRMFVLRAKVIFEPLPDFAVAGELDETASPSPAAEPALSFPAQADDGVYTIILPHPGRLNPAAPRLSAPARPRLNQGLGVCSAGTASDRISTR